jgi:hypothetical protein
MAIVVLKNRPFARWAKREQLTHKSLCAAVREIRNGLVDARLGGFLFKKRIAKDHKGKRYSNDPRLPPGGQAGFSLRFCEAGKIKFRRRGTEGVA